ncbi:alpha/beta hydrolase [Leucobacter coleopterorum]|uniref:Alpha/beta hydrolase n=1 Tax=Leucobacter coleopterorum TaxID=2714933 RepID=A0ABX6JTW4_9MICO|nr:alpha/beta hydrolase [Leucobacter coleopterorum]QIM17726.1 alpha/beta hydrolase [Leucobacter coleopterorum]
MKSGNSIAYSGNFRNVKTVFVVLSGLGVPAEAYTWLAAHLKSHTPDSGVLLVERAGYGGSAWRASGDDRMARATEDLADLLSRLQVEDSFVVGVGHSLGGEVLRRISWEHPSLFDAYMLLDATNPAQFDDGVFPQWEKDNMLAQIRKDEVIAKLGFGSLMVPAIPTTELPASYRRRADIAQRDSKIWTSARKELKSLFDSKLRKKAQLFSPGSRGLVFAAEATYNKPELKKLQDDIAREVMTTNGDPSSSQPIIIDGDHMDMVLRSTHAARVALEISLFVSSGNEFR